MSITIGNSSPSEYVGNISSRLLKTESAENNVEVNNIPAAKDEYISSENDICKPIGLYHIEQDEDGNPKVIYDAPDKSEKQINGLPTDKAEKCTTNTDKVDREIEKLKEKKRQIEQQIQSETDENKKQALEKQLAQVDAELSQKNNDAYRRKNAVVS